MKSKIDCLFIKHDGSRICQGDLLRDIEFNYVKNSSEVEEIYLQYSVIISQDCDLEQFQNKYEEVEIGDVFNQYIPNILILPAFPATSLKEGNHLSDLYNYKQDRINSSDWKLVKANRNDRYHYIKGDVDQQIPDLVCDFKHFFSLSFSLLKEQFGIKYLSSMSELFRESLSQRFTNYISRIGLPVL